MLIGRRNPDPVELNGIPVDGQTFLVLTVGGGKITQLSSYAARAGSRQAAGLAAADDWR